MRPHITFHTYQNSNVSSFRRPIYVRQTPPKDLIPSVDTSPQYNFHKSLPSYAQTPLVSLDGLAKDVGIKAVYIKNESSRFGLPSFKVTGASWGTFRALVSRLGLDVKTATLDQVSKTASEQSLKLVAATDGNHGRAVAWMAKLLGITADIYVSKTLDGDAKQNIVSEGACVIVVNGEYDMAVQTAASTVEPNAVFVQDTAFEGYEDIPSWIIDGYATLFREMDTQLQEQDIQATTIITPVGVGSLAQAVTTFAKAAGRDLDVVAVEPDTAPCLYESLKSGIPRPIDTFHTVMSGLNCGTVSSTAWPYLRDHVNYSVTISDYEAHSGVQYLEELGISSGPCGASGLAALRHLTAANKLDKDAVALLINTEGRRPYNTPFDVSSDDPIKVAQTLTQIDSANPSLSLSSSPSAGETTIANYVCAWLMHRGIETHLVETIPGRPSVVGVVRGTGEGKSLMLNGHIDTVSLATYDSEPLSGHVSNDRIYGRGVLDMKAGVAANMTALAKSKDLKLRGDLILAAVSDEEFESQGTTDILAAGWKADAAFVPEPTSLTLHHSHKGFIWAKIDILGVAAHGSDPATGVDAIMSTSAFLTALEAYGKTLPIDPFLGPGTMHCGTIIGGEEPSSYPAQCSLTIEFRTVSGQTSNSIRSDLESILASIAKSRPVFHYAPPTITFERAPLLPLDESPFVEAVQSKVGQVLGKQVEATPAKFWTDAALLSQAGIPAVVFGPSGEGLHGKEEWVDVDSVSNVEKIIREVIGEWCV